MSSSITGNSFHEGKLLVHIAENGNSFELDCNETTLVEEVMRLIEEVSGIHFNDQILLCLDMKLEPQRPISAYKLPADDREVFIFNKLRLQINSPPPPPEQIEIPEVPEPVPPGSSCDPHPLDDASDPALKALPSYERQFRHHYHRGHVMYTRTLVKYEHCERLLREQKVQERAVEVGRGNLDQYYRLFHQNYQEFMKRYKQQNRIHSDLLGNFDKDVQKLSSIKLHPALLSDSRKCLLDFVKEENLRKAAENCNTSHRQFENKVMQFNQKFGEVKRKVEDLFSCRAPFRNLESMIKDHQRYITEQKSIMQSLSKDVNTVKKLVDDCLSCQVSSSLRPHDAVSALGPMYDVHDKNHLPRMLACERAISKLLDLCREKKTEMNVFVHNYMQQITYLTYVIKDARLQFPVFREAMVRQDDLFADLRLVHRIGPAYRSCLAEIVRRNASKMLYLGMAGQIAEKLAAKRELEVRRREEFIKAHSAYIPRDVLASMGLYESPSQFELNVLPFDNKLLNIDITAVDKYAPEYLAVLPSVGERLSSLKGSFSVSTDSSHSGEGVEVDTDINGKDENDNILEEIESEEISGTNKIEVENAKLKAELASAIAMMCSLCPEIEYDSLDDSKVDSLLKNAAEKTAEALYLKEEYEKHLHSMLKAKQVQCISYEKRIQELEQRLSDRCSQGQQLLNTKDEAELSIIALKSDGFKLEVSDTLPDIPCVSTSEPMDEVSCISNSLDAKLGLFTRQGSKNREFDENMMDSSAMQHSQLDSSMMEPHREETHVGEKESKDKAFAGLGMSMTNSSTGESMPDPLNSTAAEPVPDFRPSGDRVAEISNALEERTNQLNEAETKLKDALDEVSFLRRELEMNQKLLDESQMNCAYLENCLHEAREEAQGHRCAADRRAAEYSALRASVVKMRGLFERLRNSVYAPGAVAGFSDSLSALAQSLSNSVSDSDDDGTAEFRKCICVLADKVSFLSRHRAELLDKHPKVEAVIEQLRKELEEKTELAKTLYSKHQLEKQANKEKLSFGRMEVHERAAFVLNSAGYYEAINRNCSNHYLSAESVALFTDHLPTRPSYIVGQIVHIERQIVKPLPLPTSTRPEHGRAELIDQLTPADSGSERLTLNSGSNANPYGLPVGCEYFAVTIAMLPDTASIHSSSSPS